MPNRVKFSVLAEQSIPANLPIFTNLPIAFR